MPCQERTDHDEVRNPHIPRTTCPSMVSHPTSNKLLDSIYEVNSTTNCHQLTNLNLLFLTKSIRSPETPMYVCIIHMYEYDTYIIQESIINPSIYDMYVPDIHKNPGILVSQASLFNLIIGSPRQHIPAYIFHEHCCTNKSYLFLLQTSSLSKRPRVKNYHIFIQRQSRAVWAQILTSRWAIRGLLCLL